MKDDDFEKAEDEQFPPGIGKFIKAAFVYFFYVLIALLFAWVWWQGQSSKPIYQIEKMLDKNK